MKLYVVRWLRHHYYQRREADDGLPNWPAPTRLVRAFADPTEAEEYRQRLERGRTPPPPEANPFQLRTLNNLADLTSMPSEVLSDWLREVGLKPPRPNAKIPTWAKWYDAQTPTMTDAQRCRVWQALDKLRFFETIETELEA